jgi:hypothetical protein
MKRVVPWTRAEVALLIEWAGQGRTNRAISRQLCRPLHSVRLKRVRLKSLGVIKEKKVRLGETEGFIASHADIVRALRAVRRATGIPQREFDELVGLAPGYTGKIESGLRNLGPKSLNAMMEALNVALVMVPRERLKG